jgi:CRP/FNR family cyclic AMP-dependent transcriptional regulator
MLDDFQGKDCRTALLNALCNQFLVDGNSEIADKIASAAQVKECTSGTLLFHQGERGSDLCFILSGKASVRVDDEEVATVGVGMHVGEMGLLEPFNGRSASVVAIDTLLLAQVSQARFTEIARFHPEVWRRMAMELAHRLVKAQSKG